MYEHATITKRDRRMMISFDGPVIASTEHGDTDIWHERIKISCSHSASEKAYTANISWCRASQRDGYAMEQSAIFTDPVATLAKQPAARFNQNKFNMFCAAVQDLCLSIAYDEDNVSVAAELARKAQSFVLVRN